MKVLIALKDIFSVLFTPALFLDRDAKTPRKLADITWYCLTLAFLAALINFVVYLVLSILSVTVCENVKGLIGILLTMTISLVAPSYMSLQIILLLVGILAFFTLYLTSSHLLFSRFGGKAGLIDTFRASIYSITPIALLEWPSFVTMLVILYCNADLLLPSRVVFSETLSYLLILTPIVWSIVLFVYASSVFHRISIKKSFLCFLPHLIPLLLFLIFFTSTLFYVGLA